MWAHFIMDRFNACLQLFAIHPIASFACSIGALWLGFYVTKWFVNDQEIKRKFQKLPGFPYLGLVGKLLLGNVDIVYYSQGHIKNINVALLQTLGALYSVHSIRKNGLVRFQLGFDRMVALFDAKSAEQLVTSNANIGKSVFYKFFRRWLGLGLLTSTGNKWRKHRKILTPAFHFRILDSFVPIMNENCNEMVEIIEKDSLDSDKSKPRRALDIRSYVTNCTLDTICETAMGTRVGAQTGDLKYVNPLNKSLEMLMNRIINPLHRPDQMYFNTPTGKTFQYNLTQIHSFVNKVIDDRIVEQGQTLRDKIGQGGQNDSSPLLTDQELLGARKRYAFLDSLLMEHFKDPKGFTMTDIRDEVNTFMFEGHDTTSGGLMFALQLIGNDPRVQDKIYEELESIFGDDMDRSITTDDCRQMKYLEMSLKETLRLFPSVPFFARTIDQDFMVGDHLVPAGTECALFVYFLHRDESIFPQPERFRPERFAPDEPIHKMPYAYMPFSAGPRNCIGQKFAMLEMKIMVAALLRQFRLVTITQRDQIALETSILIKTNTPIEVRFEKRRP